MINDLLFSCNVVVPIFLLIVLGYVLTRVKLWDEHFLKVANNVCFKCLLPVLLFYNVASANIFEYFVYLVVKPTHFYTFYTSTRPKTPT